MLQSTHIGTGLATHPSQLQNMPPRVRNKQRELTPKMEQLFRERHWIDGRTVTRLADRAEKETA